MIERLRALWWLGWLLFILLLAGGLYGWLDRTDHSEAERQEAIADSAAAEANAAWYRAQTLRDSLEEERAARRAARDSIRELRVVVERQAEAADSSFRLETEGLNTQLAELHAAAPPRLRPAVDSIRAAVDRRTEAHRRYREGMQETVRLLRAEKASLRADVEDAWSAADSLEAGWRQERSAHEETRAALRAWKEDARRGPLESFFGDGVLQTAATIGSGWASWEFAGEDGLKGWLLAKGVDVLLETR